MTETKVDLSKYENHLGRKHQVMRWVWGIVWTVCASWMPRSFGKRWRNLLLRLFGAQIDKTAEIFGSAKIYYPKNLVMGANTCLDVNVNCYNVAPIIIDDNVTVSQGAFLCTASHDITDVKNPLITAPIHLCSQSWVAAEAFVGMGTTIGEGAVVGARAAIFKDVEPWTIVGGNPAKFIKAREMNQ